VKKLIELLKQVPEVPGQEYQGKLLTFVEQLHGVGLAFFDEMLTCRYADFGFADLAEVPVEKLLGMQMQYLFPGISHEKLADKDSKVMVLPYASEPVTQPFVSAITGRSMRAEVTPVSLRDMPLIKLVSEIDSEPRLTKLIGQSESPNIMILDNHGRLQFISRSARLLFGLPEEGEVEYTISEDANFAPQETASLVNDALMGMEVYFPPVEYSCSLPGALGHGSGRTTVLNFVFRQFDEASPSAFIGMLAFVPESPAFNPSVAFMQRSESVAMLARGVAHEFNNIFAAIKGITSLLQSEVEVESFASNYLGKMGGLIDRGVKLISDLTSYARMSEPRMDKVPVQEFFRNFTSLVDFVVPKDVKLEADIKAEGYIECDPNLLRQGLFNIVQNALDALSDLPNKRIRIFAEARDDTNSGLPAGVFRFATPDILYVSIADSGPGIPAELANRVFEPYFSTKDPQRSTGLGLNVSAQIFRRHGGVLLAERQGELGGAELRIYLPLYKQP
jgi:signal transduction histidine kinase